MHAICHNKVYLCHVVPCMSCHLQCPTRPPPPHTHHLVIYQRTYNHTIPCMPWLPVWLCLPTVLTRTAEGTQIPIDHRKMSPGMVHTPELLKSHDGLSWPGHDDDHANGNGLTCARHSPQLAQVPVWPWQPCSVFISSYNRQPHATINTIIGLLLGLRASWPGSRFQPASILHSRQNGR